MPIQNYFGMLFFLFVNQVSKFLWHIFGQSKVVLNIGIVCSIVLAAFSNRTPIWGKKMGEKMEFGYINRIQKLPVSNLARVTKNTEIWSLFFWKSQAERPEKLWETQSYFV